MVKVIVIVEIDVSGWVCVVDEIVVGIPFIIVVIGGVDVV